MKRRDFIKSSVALATTATVAGVAGGEGVVSSAEAAGGSSRPAIKRYTKLGKTNIRMSDISFGAGRLPSASMVLRAIDRGINYFDTAPDYGPSEDLLGKALKRYRHRDKIFIASKFCVSGAYQPEISHLQAGSSVDDYISSVEGSLKRLGTDYLDVVFVHAMGEKTQDDQERKRLLDSNMLEAFARLKKAGKARYLAVSSHGPHNMETLMLEAVRSGHYDIIMPAFNFMNFPRVPELLNEAQAKGVGVVAMKTLAGAKDGGIGKDAANFEHAAFKWVLKHPQVAGLVISIKSVSALHNYVAASGMDFTAQDQSALDHYAALFGQEYCRTGCGDCESSCEAGLSIATILRYQMYYEDYGDQKAAMQSYAALEKDASACLDCSSDACAASCQYGLPVPAKLKAAHNQLSFSVPA